MMMMMGCHGLPPTHVIQVTNLSAAVTSEQMRTLFTFLGDIEELRLYPPDNTPLAFSSKVCYIRYREPSSVGVAQHLTNTVFIDRALIVVPCVEGKIPEESKALSLLAPTPTLASLIPGAGLLPIPTTAPTPVINPVLTVAPVPTPLASLSVSLSPMRTTLPATVVTTVSATLDPLGDVQPPLMGNVDPTKVDEIRRTIYVGNLNSQTTTADQLLEFFKQVGDVKFVRMAGDETQPTRFAFVEFSDHNSVPRALAFNGVMFGDRPLKINHSNNAIVKPPEMTPQAAAKELEEVMKRVREAQSFISAVIEPESSEFITPFQPSEVEVPVEKKIIPSLTRTRSRSKSHSRSQSSRSSRKRSPPKHRSRSRNRSRSRHKDKRRSRSPLRKRSRSKERHRSRSRSRDRKRDKEIKPKVKEREKSRERDDRMRKDKRSRSPPRRYGSLRRSRSRSRDRRRRRSRSPSKSPKTSKQVKRRSSRSPSPRSRSKKDKKREKDYEPSIERKEKERRERSPSKKKSSLEKVKTHEKSATLKEEGHTKAGRSTGNDKELKSNSVENKNLENNDPALQNNVLQQDGLALQQEDGLALQQEDGLALQQEDGLALQQEDGLALQQEDGLALQQEDGLALQQGDGPSWPSEDSGLPSEDSGLPSEDSGLPSEDSGLPSEDQALQNNTENEREVESKEKQNNQEEFAEELRLTQ